MGGSDPWDPSPKPASASDYTETKLNFYEYDSKRKTYSMTCVYFLRLVTNSYDFSED